MFSLICLFLLLSFITEVNSYQNPICSLRLKKLKTTPLQRNTRLRLNSLENGPGNFAKFPWTSSIVPSRSLSYASFFKDQLTLLSSLNAKELPVSSTFAQAESKIRPARIVNRCFETEQFRRIRMTYFDGGETVQVFNTVWYPRYDYELPIFGTDLISLGANRILHCIDHQPLYPTEDYHQKYISHLSSARSKYPALQGSLSGKIYNDTSFFSSNILFGRFADESSVPTVTKPAFDDYLQEYLKLMKVTKSNLSNDFQEKVRQRQIEYDTYNSIKDPAVGIFNAYFGKEWSQKFIHEFLFPFTTKNGQDFIPFHQFKLDQNTGNMQLQHPPGQGYHGGNPSA